MIDFLTMAVEKLDTELKNFKGDQKATVVSSHVANTLKSLAEQETELAQAIAQSDNTLSDCCTSVMKGVGNQIADIEVYKRTVKFYMSTATIEVIMRVNTCGDIPAAEQTEQTNKILDFSIDDLFD